MWVTVNEKETEDIFICFPQFKEDYPVLEEKGIIKRIAINHYEWTEKKTSLAVYFRWLGDTAKKQFSTTGGFWAPISTVFRVDSQTLSNMASRYNDRDKYKPFMKIKNLVEPYREKIKQQKEQERKDRETFSAIKKIIDETNGNDIKEIRAALENIKTF